jgi:Effector-associated domain 7/Effector-associated domain 11
MEYIIQSLEVTRSLEVILVLRIANLTRPCCDACKVFAFKGYAYMDNTKLCLTSRELIAAGKLAQAIELLMGFVNANPTEKRITEDLVVLSSRYHLVRRSTLSGLISSSESNVENNRIAYALLEIIDSISGKQSAIQGPIETRDSATMPTQPVFADGPDSAQDFSTQMRGGNALNPSQLREFIVRHFDSEELRTLCHDVDVDYDSLRGEGKAGKARELVLFMERRDRLDQLRKAMIATINSQPNRSSEEATVILNELQALKHGQQQMLSRQEETLITLQAVQTSILGAISQSYRESIRVLLSAMSEQEIRTVQAIIDSTDRQQISVEEMENIRRAIIQGYKELKTKSLLVSQDRRIADEADHIAGGSMFQDMALSGKLKLSIPLIPTILTYETELSLNVKETLQSFWIKFSK